MRRVKLIASFGLVALLLSLRPVSAQPQGVTGCPGSDQNNVCTGSGDDRDYGLVAGGVVRMKITRSGAVTFPGALGVTFPAVLGQALHADGTASLPSISFTSEPNTGFYRNSSTQVSLSVAGTQRFVFTGNTFLVANDGGILGFGASNDTALTRTAAGKLSLTGTTPMLQLGGTSSSFPALLQSGAKIALRLADNSTFTTLTVGNIESGPSGNLLTAAAAPTISSGFGGTPSIANNNGSASFTVNVGTGGAATSGVIGLSTAATGWNCWVNDLTAAAAHVAYNTRQTASTTTTATLENQTTSTGAAVAWGVSDILRVSCFAY